MKFILEVDLSAGTLPERTAEELGRILRYWAGNVQHYPLADGDSEVIYDSAHQAVGTWTVNEELPGTGTFGAGP